MRKSMVLVLLALVFCWSAFAQEAQPVPFNEEAALLAATPDQLEERLVTVISPTTGELESSRIQVLKVSRWVGEGEFQRELVTVPAPRRTIIPVKEPTPSVSPTKG